MSEWQNIYRDQLEHRAEIVTAVLSEHNLNPVLISKKDSSYRFGHFEVRVPQDEVLKALKIINEEIRFE